MRLIATLFLTAVFLCAADIAEKDRSEALMLQRDLAIINSQFLTMTSQYEANVKTMQEQSGAKDKQLTALRAKLQKSCEAEGKVFEEKDVACVAKPDPKAK